MAIGKYSIQGGLGSVQDGLGSVRDYYDPADAAKVKKLLDGVDGVLADGGVRIAIGTMDQVPPEHRGDKNLKLFANPEDYVAYLKENPELLAARASINDRGELVVQEPLPASLLYEKGMLDIYLPKHTLTTATTSKEEMKRNIIELGIAQADADRIIKEHFEPVIKESPVFYSDVPNGVAPQSTSSNANNDQAASSASAASNSRTIPLPDKTEKNVELSQETFTQSIGKAIMAFLNNIGISPSSVEGQNVLVSANNNINIDHNQLAETTQKVTGIRPDILALAGKESCTLKTAGACELSHANQNTIALKPVSEIAPKQTQVDGHAFP